jgi:hypothetical protein
MKLIKVICLALSVILAGSGHARSKFDGGSSDGGGQAIGSSPESVRYAIEFLRHDLHNLVHRLRIFADHEPDFGLAYLLKQFDQSKLDKTIDQMAIIPIDGPCVSPIPDHKDGCFNKAAMSISLSVGQLTRFDSDSLRLQVVALGWHELMHLMDKTEDEAQHSQEWLVFHPQIARVFDQKPIEHLVLALFVNNGDLNDILYSEKWMRSNSSLLCRALTRFNVRKRTNFLGESLPDGLLSFADESIPQINFSRWENEICDSTTRPSDILTKLNRYVNRAKVILKNMAQTLDDYDSLNNRNKKWIDMMN